MAHYAYECTCLKSTELQRAENASTNTVAHICRTYTT